MRLSRLLLVAIAVSALGGCTGDPASLNRFARQMEATGIGTESRDPLAFYEAAAEAEADPRLKPRFLRDLAAARSRRGETAAAFEAFERAALLGDRAAGTRILKAGVAGLYEPREAAGIARAVLLPRALGERSLSAMLLLADLVGAGRIAGPEFRSERHWLELAAAAGSRRARLHLAERAEARGDLEGAAKLHLALDPATGPASRARLQAQRRYLGRPGEAPNRRLGLAWLDYAAELDPAEAAKLAVRLHRADGEAPDRRRLAAIAKAGGLSVGAASPASSLSGTLARLATRAPGDPEVPRLLAIVRAAAEGGDRRAMSALVSLHAAGGPVPRSEADSRRWLARLAAAGDPAAAAHLAALPVETP